MTTVLWWIRRDLRLADNPALDAALLSAETVTPVFVFDPFFERSAYVGEKRMAFMVGGLRALDADLRARGSRLIVRGGDPVAALARLREETGAAAIFAQEDVSPYARGRDASIARSLPLTLVAGQTIFPPEAVVKSDGEPFVVFTPYSRAWKALPQPSRADLIPAPARLPPIPDSLSSEPLLDQPALPEGVPFPPGEIEAQHRLDAFTRGSEAPIYAYGQLRNLPGVDGTSLLSPYLRWGMISARACAAAAHAAIVAAPTPEAHSSAETWLNELIWREFYTMILYRFPHVRGRSFRPEYDRIRWLDDKEGFAAWCAGRTGYPIVDAAMRQLVCSGWMHNRTRMIAASFLVKDLLIDWRRGEQFFMQHLVDGDVAANNGGWQWTAGTGTDAAPYFRIFSPVSQGQKFDPQGEYVRRWLPELARVPDEYVHQPWTMPADLQRVSGCVIGRDYPAPIVDHAIARERVLAAYAAAKS